MKRIVLFLLSTIVFLAAKAQGYTFNDQFGKNGTGNSQFSFPTGIELDAAGNVFVADRTNDRIQVFDPSGTYLYQWGSHGSGNGQFFHTEDLAFDAAGDVYVVDGANGRIQKFTAAGVYISGWGTQGSGDGQFFNPCAIEIDAAGNIYVVDQGNHRVQKFSPNGTYITQWFANAGSGIAIDAAGNIYVTDYYAINKYDAAGNFLMQISSQGAGTGQVFRPSGVAVDAAGNIYVADNINHRIQKFSSSGIYITQIGEYGDGDGQFSFPGDVAVNDQTGDIYITDSGNGRVHIFSAPCPDTTLNNTVPMCSGSSYDLNQLKTVTTGVGTWSIQGTGANYPTLAGSVFTTTLNTAPGNYTIRYTINPPLSANCIAYNERVIIVLQTPLLSLSTIPDQCLNDLPLDLSAYVNLSSGSWSGAGVTGNFFNRSESGTAALSYSIAGACPVQQSTVVNVAEKPDALISGDSIICNNNSGVQFSVNNTGGIWYGAGINNSGYFPVKNITPGNYPIQYQMNNVACKDTAHHHLKILDAPAVAAYCIDSVICYGEKIHLRDTSQLKGVAYSWSLSDNNGVPAMTKKSSGASSFYTIASAIDPGTYDFELSVELANGCSSLAEIKNAFTVSTTPEAIFSLSVNELTVTDSLVEFTNISAFPYDSLLWQFSSKGNPNQVTGNIATVHNPLSVVFKTKENDTIPVCLTLFNKGCKDTHCEQILVKSTSRIYVPNAFTPNGDGNNELFIPEGVFFDGEGYSLMIFDRWGELVFETDNSATGWNGKRNNNMQDAPQDVYVWKIVYANRFMAKSRKTLIGHVTLLR